MRRFALATLVVAAVSGVYAGAAGAANPNNTTALQKAVKVSDILVHERALAGIAQRNGNTRASGTPGFLKSRDYVVDTLTKAGYKPTVQAFDFPFFAENTPSTFDRLSPDPHTYTDDEFGVMQYSGSGDATGNVQAVDLVLPPGPEASTSTSGCEASDFAGFTPGNVALIQRGTCTFEDKAKNAAAAGAVAAIIFNEGQEGRTDSLAGSTLGTPQSIPVVGTTFAVGDELAGLVANGPVSVHITTDVTTETRPTYNVIAETKGGRADHTVVVGGHLDSVLEGPGINDDGSGTSTNLAVALAMAKKKIKPVNKVRFIWFGGEENGLLGSTHYVESLSQEQQDDVGLMLDFDMLASPNYVRFVYDGDASDNPDLDPGPVGSDVIEARFNRHFTGKHLATEPTPFDGRSDYQGFIDVGIPAGGIFAGAEVIKTPEEAAIFGGTAGEPFDKCYHQACDTLANLNLQSMDEMSDAVADSVGYFAARKASLADPSPTAKRLPAQQREFRGDHKIR